MSALRPEQVVHRGNVAAAGLLFTLEPAGGAVLRARVLAHWQPGASLLALDARRAVLLLPNALRVDSDRCEGAALVRDALGNLLAAPLRPAEAAALPLHGGSLVLVEAGCAQLHALDACERIDPAQWLDLSDFERVEAAPLCELERAEGLMPTTPEARDIHALLGASVPQPTPEQRRMLESLQRATSAETPLATRTRPRGWLPRGLAACRALLDGLRFAIRRRPRARAGVAQSGSGGALRTRGMWSKLGDWLSARAAQLLYWSQLSRLLGAAQARYLRDLLERFEGGDLHDALRRAIPLSDPRAAQALRQALAPPKPRDALTLSANAGGAGSSLAVDHDVLALLRRTYETAARKLEREGRIEEAAYVWAELLADPETAVALLERNQRLRQAAELAEGRELAPGLVVRQWFIAGDEARALAIARRHGAFADAIVRLQKSAQHSGAAQRLRVLYGDALAEAGDYAGAVDALWPVDEARHLAAALLLRALEAGGAQAGRSLARMLSLCLEPLPSLLQRVRALALDRLPCAADVRLAFGRALLAEEPVTPVLRSGAHAVLRALVGDAARGHVVLDRALRDGLTELASDAALRADLPALGHHGPRETLASGSRCVAQMLAARDRGSLCIEDAALLPNGQLLLALGELGMRLYRADLRSFTTLLEPAYCLVLNSEGTRALALAPRGRRYRLARVDLNARRVQSWCDCELDGFAREFDGTRWFVAVQGALVAIDATQEEFRALWRVAGVARAQANACLSEVVTSPAAIEVLATDLDAVEYWRYEPDSLKLRVRKSLQTLDDGPTLLRLRPGAGQVVQLSLLGDQQSTVATLHTHEGSLALCNVDGGFAGADLRVSRDWAAAALTRATDTEVLLVHLPTRRMAVRMSLEGSLEVRLRLTDHSLLIADELGRVRGISLLNGAMLCDLRAAV